MKIQLTLADPLIIGFFVYLGITDSSWWLLLAAAKFGLIFVNPRWCREHGWRWRRDD